MVVVKLLIASGLSLVVLGFASMLWFRLSRLYLPGWLCMAGGGLLSAGTFLAGYWAFGVLNVGVAAAVGASMSWRWRQDRQARPFR